MAKSIKSAIRAHWDEVVAYTLSFWTSVLSGNLGSFKEAGPIELDFSAGRLSIAAFLALAVTLVQEFIPPVLAEDVKIRTKAGKRRNLAKRFFFAIIFGFAATQIVDTAMGFFPKLRG